jgi:hypothetical protein
VNVQGQYFSAVRATFCACGCTQSTVGPIKKKTLEMLYDLPTCIPEVMVWFPLDILGSSYQFYHFVYSMIMEILKRM